MAKVYALICCALLLGAASCKESSRKKAPPTNLRLHWLNPKANTPGFQMTEKEEDLLNNFKMFISTADGDGDGKISFKEFTSAKELLLIKDEGDNALTYDVLREFLVVESEMMLPEVFEHMWWLMTNEREELSDYTKAFFDHVDMDHNGQWERKEVEELIYSGCMSDDSPEPETKYRPMIESLDSDGSRGISQDEIWKSLADAIVKHPGIGLPVFMVVEAFKKRVNLTSDVLDYELVAKCLDYNKDGFISIYEEVNIVNLFDTNYSGEIEEHELKEVTEAFTFCKENPSKVRGGEGKEFDLPGWKSIKHQEL